MNKKILIGIIVVIVAIIIGVYFLLMPQSEKVYRVGIIGGVEAFGDIADGFKAGMTELGYKEGENIIYDTQVANFDMAGLEQVSQKFVQDGVDLIFTFPTEPAVVAKKAIQGTNIPVVFDIAGLEGTNLVENVREPGGNITGVRYPGPELVVTRFEFLTELVPRLKRLLIPYDPTYPNTIPALTALRPIAASKGVTLVEAPISSVDDLQVVFQTQASDIDAIQILPEALTQSPAAWTIISNFAKKHQLPLLGSMSASVNMGAVFSYCVDFFEVGKLAASSAGKILRGIQAGTIPVLTAEAHLRINYKNIQELGLTIPEDLLNRADEIIR